MPRFTSQRRIRTGSGVILLLSALFFGAAPAAFPRTAAENMEQAKVYFNNAQEMFLALQQVPAEERGQKDYVKVVRAFQRVYHTSPASPYNARSLMTIGQIYQLMARSMGYEKYFYSAIKSYEFLIREYPHSIHQPNALLAIGRIYQNDLSLPVEAAKRFNLFLKKFPRSPRANEALLAIRAIRAPKVSADSGNRVPVTDIRQWVTPDFTRVVINLDAEVKYNVGRLTSPSRIYLDFYDAKINRALARKTMDSDGGAVKRIRAAQHKPDITRVVLDVVKAADYSISELPNPYRLIIDVLGPSGGGISREQTAQNKQHREPPASSLRAPPAERPGQPAKSEQITKQVIPANTMQPASLERTAMAKAFRDSFPETKPAREQQKSISAPVAAAKVVQETSLAGSQTARLTLASSTGLAAAKGSVANSVTESTVPEPPSNAGDNAEQTADKVIFSDLQPETIQPAQPKRDGSRSLTRALGLKIGRIILDPGHGGHDTGTIGPNGLYEKDLVLDVAKRLGEMITERLGSEVIYTRTDDTFVPLGARSAIANQKQADLFLSIHANSSPSKKTRGVETYYLSFTTDREALELAARENAGSQESIHQLQDLVKKIALNEKVDESKEFAAEVQAALSDSAGKQKDRGVKKAPFMVLVGARMPAVLAEVTFLSNPQEAKLLRSKAQRQKLAEALYTGIRKYADTLSGVRVARTNNIETAASQ